MRHFCAYQERSKKQVMLKLVRLGAEDGWVERLLQILEQEDFINESRFQQAFIRGKARTKGWGPEKIRQRLFQELGRAPDEGLEINREDGKTAEQKMHKALQKKYDGLRQKQDPQWRARLIRFCMSRGFDWETAARLIEALEKGS